MIHHPMAMNQFTCKIGCRTREIKFKLCGPDHPLKTNRLFAYLLERFSRFPRNVIRAYVQVSVVSR